MDDTTIKLRCCTYNIHGFNSTKLSYIRHLLDLFNIVMIQEHWLNDKFPDSLGSSVTFIDSKSDRLCALSLHIIHSIQLYLFCIYMQYHYAIRKLKRNAIALRRNAMAESIINNNSRDLWSEIRKVRNTTKTVSTCIDGVTGDINIAELFSNKYNELYNSVRYEQQSLNDLFVDNKYDIQAYCIDDVNNDMYNHTHCIDVNQIMSAVHKLKPGKSDCIDNMYSDNFKNGTYTLYHMISMLFTSMLIHGVSPGDLLLSTLVPIPKNKRGNNYRQIAINSILGKIFDIIVLDAQYDSLSTDVLQFGFKKNSSTVICASILLDTIEYYNENNTDCYLLLLDASKAFDRVEYVKLFKMLKDRNMCPILLRLLMYMYVNQKIQDGIIYCHHNIILVMV